MRDQLPCVTNCLCMPHARPSASSPHGLAPVRANTPTCGVHSGNDVVHEDGGQLGQRVEGVQGQGAAVAQLLEQHVERLVGGRQELCWERGANGMRRWVRMSGTRTGAWVCGTERVVGRRVRMCWGGCQRSAYRVRPGGRDASGGRGRRGRRGRGRRQFGAVLGRGAAEAACTACVSVPVADRILAAVARRAAVKFLALCQGPS